MDCGHRKMKHSRSREETDRFRWSQRTCATAWLAGGSVGRLGQMFIGQEPAPFTEGNAPPGNMLAVMERYFLRATREDPSFACCRERRHARQCVGGHCPQCYRFTTIAPSSAF